MKEKMDGTICRKGIVMKWKPQNGVGGGGYIQSRKFGDG
jgi:hypothetical protein